mgnify:CR=1 FL=1
MKLSIIILLNILTFTMLNAQTTMCFKENHKSMSTIETVKLDGGLCQGQNSVKDMHKTGWETDDIKINNSNYIYIFKKKTALLADIDMDALEQKVVQKLQKAEEEKKIIAKEKLRIGKLNAGKKTYINKCQLCHGPKGMNRAENTSRPIGNFTLNKFIRTMRGYVNEDKDYYRGRAMIMKPYADTTDSNDIKNIYVYLKNINSANPEKLVEEKK